MPISYRESKNYSVPRNLAFKEALDALNTLGFKIKNSDEFNGTIEARKGASIRSWGEGIKISITPSNGGSQVYVESDVRYQVVDYGKNKDNVDKILTELDNRLLSPAQMPPPPPPPTTPAAAQTCPTCDQPMTFIQQYNRWYCPNCKKYP
jgi:hypothetical protein